MNLKAMGLTALVGLSGVALTDGASAAAFSGTQQGVVVDHSLVQKTEFYFDGRDYCFYNNGWRGPGYYWCGYNFRRGYGWGGGYNWNGWGRRGEFYRGGGDRFRGDRGRGEGGRGERRR